MMDKLRRAGAINWLAQFLLVGAALYLFLDLAGDVWLKEGFAWDVPIMQAVHRLHTPWLDQLFLAITATAGVLHVGPTLAAAAVLWWRKSRELAVLLPFSMAGAIASSVILKAIFARPRPAVFPPLTVESSYSFPSGHTLAAIAVYGLIAVFLWPRHRVGSILAGLWVLLVALSRVYLGVHYPSDVVASLAVGTVWLMVVLSFRRPLARWFALSAANSERNKPKVAIRSQSREA